VLPRVRPMRLRCVKEPFDNPDYIFELKHDGFRAVVYLQNGECKIVSGKPYDLRVRSSSTANPRQNSVEEPGSGVGLPAVMIRAKSPGTEKPLFRKA
jgi:hypothetical protein